jgi:hypothetical protein
LNKKVRFPWQELNKKHLAIISQSTSTEAQGPVESSQCLLPGVLFACFGLETGFQLMITLAENFFTPAELHNANEGIQIFGF